jgi:hypothetical protein
VSRKKQGVLDFLLDLRSESLAGEDEGDEDDDELLALYLLMRSRAFASSSFLGAWPFLNILRIARLARSIYIY